VFFPSQNFLGKMLYQGKLRNTLQGAKKVFCFESNTTKELNERIDIAE